MVNYWFGDKPKYDVEMFFVENENWKEKNESMYVVNKIIVNKPSMYSFYEKNYSHIELVKGFNNG